MSLSTFLRYLAPNLVTSVNLLFGLLALLAVYEHRYVDAGWWIIWAVLVDRIDGAVARALNATSTFGMYLDSFADFLNFGIAPACLVFVSLSQADLGFTSGGGRLFVLTAAALWVLANATRLAKFNCLGDRVDPKMFFGVPTTLAAGTLVIWYIVILKYGVGPLAAADAFNGPRILGGWAPSPGFGGSWCGGCWRALC